MFGHLPLPDHYHVASIPLPPLATIASQAWWIIGILFALTACGLTYGHLRRQRKNAAKPVSAPPKRRPVLSPFDELIDAHTLDASEVGLMRQAVKQLELEQPILLFVDPSLLARFCDANPEAEFLRQKLFDAAEEPEQPDPNLTNRTCSDLQTDTREVEQPDANLSSSIEDVTEDLLGGLPSADESDANELPASVVDEQPVGAQATS